MQWKMIIQCTNVENAKIATDLCRLQARVTTIYFYIWFFYIHFAFYFASMPHNHANYSRFVEIKNDTILTSSILDTFWYFDPSTRGAKK